MTSIHWSSIEYPIKGIPLWLEMDMWGWKSEEDGDGHCLSGPAQSAALSQELLGGNGKGSSRERSPPRIPRTETSGLPPAFLAASSQRSLGCALGGAGQVGGGAS